mgnify:CR=1 FL=1
MTAPNFPIDVVIMAAGKGTRMKSRLPKVLQRLAGVPLVQHVLGTAAQLNARSAVVITGHGADQVEPVVLAPGQALAVQCVRQEPQLGTGHAVQQAVPALADDGVVVVLSGDVPLTQADTLQALIAQCGGQQLALLLTRSIVAPLREALSLAECIERGDLTHKVDVHGKDEPALLLAALASMQHKLCATLRGIGDSADQLAASAEQMSAVMEESNRDLQQQTDEINQAATAVTQMSSAVDEVAGIQRIPLALIGASVQEDKRTISRFSAGVLQWGGRSITLLDDEQLLAAMSRSLT